eukprot:5120789-Lingulodinium_polyedra.AAC.1
MLSHVVLRRAATRHSVLRHVVKSNAAWLNVVACYDAPFCAAPQRVAGRRASCCNALRRRAAPCCATLRGA